MQNWPNQETNGIYNHKNNNNRKTKGNTIQQKNEK